MSEQKPTPRGIVVMTARGPVRRDRRRLKRDARKAAERDGGFTRRQCYEPVWWPR